MDQTIKISAELMKMIRTFASGEGYKYWLSSNHLKGNIVNAAKFLLSTKGDWNVFVNSIIQRYEYSLNEIIENPDAEVRVIQKTIEIYTIGYREDEHVEMY